MVKTVMVHRVERTRKKPPEPLAIVERRGRLRVRTVPPLNRCSRPSCKNHPAYWLSFKPDPRRKLLIRRAYCAVHAQRYRQDAVMCEPWSSEE